MCCSHFNLIWYYSDHCHCHWNNSVAGKDNESGYAKSMEKLKEIGVQIT